MAQYHWKSVPDGCGLVAEGKFVRPLRHNAGQPLRFVMLVSDYSSSSSDDEAEALATGKSILPIAEPELIALALQPATSSLIFPSSKNQRKMARMANSQRTSVRQVCLHNQIA